MGVITEFLSSINIWLAWIIINFSIFFIVYGGIVCVRLVKDMLNPREYTEKDDYYEGSLEDRYYYDFEDTTKTDERG